MQNAATAREFCHELNRLQISASLTPRTIGEMAVNAYILIQTEVGKAPPVATAARALPGVLEADELIGSYDVIIKVTAESLDELGPNVVSRVQMIEGITRTITCPVIHL